MPSLHHLNVYTLLLLIIPFQFGIMVFVQFWFGILVLCFGSRNLETIQLFTKFGLVSVRLFWFDSVAKLRTGKYAKKKLVKFSFGG